MYWTPYLPIKPIITAVWAMQGTDIAISVAAMNFSLSPSRIRVESMAGTLQPKPRTIGIVA